MQSHCTSSLEQVFVAEEERECRNVRRHMSKVSLLVMYSTVPSSYESKCSTNYMKECSSSGFIENSSVARKMPKENCCLILLIRRISCLIATRSSRNMVSISVEILESGVGGILLVLEHSKQLSLNKFFDQSTPSMRKVDDGEKKEKKRRKKRK